MLYIHDADMLPDVIGGCEREGLCAAGKIKVALYECTAKIMCCKL